MHCLSKKKGSRGPSVAKNVPGREEILAAIREAAPAPGETWDKRKKTLGLRAFTAKTGIRMCHIQRHFPSWNEALKAAGGDVAARLTCITPEELLADWGLVTRKMQRPPPFIHYSFHGKYNGATMAKRFGSWHNVRGAFREFAKDKEEWADVVKLCDLPARMVRRDSRTCRRSMHDDAGATPRVVEVAAGKPLEDRPVLGEPLGLLALRNAPTNEMGVILVAALAPRPLQESSFGMLAERLGFHIEVVRAAFPDCLALRKVGRGEWQNVTIEFEFLSGNFHEHGHAPNGCDIIVCWEHNWPECPANLEVIALREVIGKREMTKLE